MCIPSHFHPFYLHTESKYFSYNCIPFLTSASLFPFRKFLTQPKIRQLICVSIPARLVSLKSHQLFESIKIINMYASIVESSPPAFLCCSKKTLCDLSGLYDVNRWNAGHQEFYWWRCNFSVGPKAGPISREQFSSGKDPWASLTMFGSLQTEPANHEEMCRDPLEHPEGL